MRRSRIIVAPLMALMLFAGESASADAVAATVFTGSAHLTCSITFPSLDPTPPTCSFTATSGTKNPANKGPGLCVGAQADSPLKAQPSGKPKTGVNASCSLTATGSFGPGITGLGPWCGHSGGTFVAHLQPNIDIFASWQSAGGTLVINGTVLHGGQSGPFVSIVNAGANAFKGASCTVGSSNFYFVGVGVGLKTGPK